MENSKKLIRLGEDDNVFVLPVNANIGAVFTFENANYTISENLTLGHKIASKDIVKGEKIIKYNVSIGSAIKDIMKGEHVHIHNIKSDFIPTHTADN